MENTKLNNLVRDLRRRLHNCAELSGQEVRTIQILNEFLQTHTDFKTVCTNGYLYAYKHLADNLPSIAFRADIDAIMGEQGSAPRHGCGHDGHAAILAGLGVALSHNPIADKNIYLLFQPAEEIGSGARQIVEDGFIQQHNIKEIYGLHNIPGIAQDTVICRMGIFACTSKGLTVKLTGRPSHAAYPEAGINPVYAFAELVNKLNQPVENAQGLVLCTIVHLQVGQKAFGTAAAQGELSMTLRAEYERDLNSLEAQIRTVIKQRAEQYGLEYEFACCDEFPETANSEACVAKVVQACRELGLNYEHMQQPMRWSEDFGYYTKQTQGAFFGLGAGLDYPQLHTDGYDFPDQLLTTGINLFYKLAQAKL